MLFQRGVQTPHTCFGRDRALRDRGKLRLCGDASNLETARAKPALAYRGTQLEHNLPANNGFPPGCSSYRPRRDVLVPMTFLGSPVTAQLVAWPQGIYPVPDTP